MKVVAISGNFDPLHIGHLRHIQEAQKLSARLIVILTTDEQCAQKKKGLLANFTVVPYEERKELIEGYLRLKQDEVVPNIDKDLTSARSLGFYHPDIFAKGGDRDSLSNLPQNEINVCREKGIEIVFGVGGGKIQASSNILGRIEETITTKIKNKLDDIVKERFKTHIKSLGYNNAYSDNCREIEYLDLRDQILKEVELL